MRRLFAVSTLLLIALLAAAKQRFWYVYSPGAGTTTISHGSLQHILAVTRQYKGPYLWAELDGRRYIIRDDAVFGEVHKVLPLRALAAPLEALHSRMHPLEKRASRLEKEIDAITDREDDEDISARDRDRLRQIEQQLRVVERELRELEREESRLDQKQDALDDPIDNGIRAIVERAIRNGVAERVK